MERITNYIERSESALSIGAGAGSQGEPGELKALAVSDCAAPSFGRNGNWITLGGTGRRTGTGLNVS